eukprot:335043-Alexandrium_andersonii.AAC.1
MTAWVRGGALETMKESGAPHGKEEGCRATSMTQRAKAPGQCKTVAVASTKMRARDCLLYTSDAADDM